MSENVGKTPEIQRFPTSVPLRTRVDKNLVGENGKTSQYDY
jgi:hypothetical protein